jgi:hypothetical protein
MSISHRCFHLGLFFPQERLLPFWSVWRFNPILFRHEDPELVFSLHLRSSACKAWGKPLCSDAFSMFIEGSPDKEDLSTLAFNPLSSPSLP